MIAWEIRLRAMDGTLVGVLDQDAAEGTAAFAFTRVVNGVGALAMQMRGEAAKLALIERDGQIECRWRDDEYGVPDHQEYEGFFRVISNKYTRKDGHIATLKAVSYLDLLRRTIVDAAAGTAQADKNGAAETVLKAYVDEQAGPGAGARARSGLSVEVDSADGDTVNMTESGQNLLDVCQRIARIGGGDFDIVGTGPATFELRWYAGQRGTDRSSTVIFSIERGNLEDATWDIWGEDVNAVLVAGQGEGAARQRTWYTDAARMAATTWNRIETFIDARDTSEANTHASRAAEEMERSRPKQPCTFRALHMPGCMYGLHYGFGDLVKVELGGMAYTKKVAKVSFEMDKSGTKISPMSEDNA